MAGSERSGVQGGREMGMLLQGWCTSTREQGGEELEEELMAVHESGQQRGQLRMPDGGRGRVGGGEGGV